MMTWLRLRLEREDGISLVEMLVAMFILAISLSAMASTLIASLASIHKSELETRATALGTELIEHLQGTRWADVGFYAGDFSSTPPARTVLLPGTRSPAAAPSDPGCETLVPPLPSCMGVERDGIDYALSTDVRWVDDAADGTGASDADGDTNDYKHLRVTVTWQTPTGARDLVVEGRRAPNAIEDPLGVFEVQLVSITDKALLRDTPSITTTHLENDEPVTLGVRTPVPATTVKAEFETYDPTTGSYATKTVFFLNPSGDKIEWERTIAAGDYQFPNGETLFTITAENIGTGESVQAIGRVLFYLPLDVGAPSISSNPIQVDGTGALCNALTFDVEVQGVVSSDSVEATWYPTTPPTPGTALTVVDTTVEGVRYTHTFPASTGSFPADPAPLDITAFRGHDGATAPVSTSYPVVVGC
ncbi:MAG: type IV pilus modification PilV family protein [Egibacteraceae bacterium]